MKTVFRLALVLAFTSACGLISAPAAGTGMTADTPRVFCAVNAVTAVAA